MERRRGPYIWGMMTDLLVCILIIAAILWIGYGLFKLVGLLWSWRPWECCEHGSWISRTNLTGLQRALEMQLYGQHLVIGPVLSAVTGHLWDNDPLKPLVLSFHGTTGTGKNFVARIIAESIYEKGMDSRFVHIFSAHNDFPHESHLDRYKDELRRKVSQCVASCPYQLFIFDEVEDMPQGLLDSIKPFLDYRAHVNGVDYRKTIFIFLSNTAGRDIAQRTFQNEGNREDLTLREMEHIIEKSAFNEGGGLRRSRLIDRNLVSHYVPFLPLERSHVRDCIRARLWKYHFRASMIEEIVDKVLLHLQFTPEDNPMFAQKGCKNVAEKVQLVMYRDFRQVKNDL